MNRTLIPAPLKGRIKAIPSKSYAHRLLICAALAKESTAIRCPGSSRDIQATAACLQAMGAGIQLTQDGFSVTPGAIPPKGLLPCGESGSTLRFLLPVAAALGMEASFLMEGRLPERPLAPLDAQLEAHGIRLERPQSNLLQCSGKLQPGDYVLPGDVSSQFISGLLFALPLLDKPSTLTITGTVESAPYIGMTLAALKQFGVEIAVEGQCYRIPASGFRSPGTAAVEGDWSNAAFWLCAGALTGEVSVDGLNPDSLQGDKAVVELLTAFGAVCSREQNSYTVSPASLRALEIDAAAVPDLVPVLAVVAAMAQGTTRIYNAGRLRLKESDRLTAVRTLLENLGVAAEETEDGLLIHGTDHFSGGTVDSFGDHRIAMAAAVAAIRADGPVTITGAQAVEKSYPLFWEDYMTLCASR